MPLELQATVPSFRIPFVPIIQEGENPFAMFHDLSYPWVLDLLVYNDLSALLQLLNRAIIEPALEKHKELTEAKSSNTVTRNASDYL